MNSARRRGVAHINFPVDSQSLPVKSGSPSKRNIKDYATSRVFAQRAGLPTEEDLQHAADILDQGEKIAILAGQGALHESEQLLTVAEMLGAPIVKALLGRACVPDDSP